MNIGGSGIQDIMGDVNSIKNMGKQGEPVASPKVHDIGVDQRNMSQGTWHPSFKDGGDVKETGLAHVHKGEHVLSKDTMDHLKLATHALGNHEHSDKPKKEIKHMTITKAKGGHIIKHEHHNPEHHPDETHVTQGTDSLVNHVMDHMSDQNPGEAEADQGQSGIPGGAPAGPPAGGGGAPPMGMGA